MIDITKEDIEKGLHEICEDPNIVLDLMENGIKLYGFIDVRSEFSRIVANELWEKWKKEGKIK